MLKGKLFLAKLFIMLLKKKKLKNLALQKRKNLVVLKQNQVDVVHLKKQLKKKLNSFILNSFKNASIISRRFF
jgi:hypothetical protein